MYPNLYEYYKSKGQKLPSISKRRAVAQTAGISNYSGTNAQNEQLLTYLAGTPSKTTSTARNTPVTSIGGSSLLRTNTMMKLPFTQENDVDLGLVSEDEPVAFETPVAFGTNLYSDDESTTNNLDVGGDNFLDFNYEQQDTSDTKKQQDTSDTKDERDRLRKEVSALETKIGERPQRTQDAYSDAGVFDDIRTLNTMKANLKALEDRNIEIPIEATQELRGTGATLAEFEQTTTPRLERNALKSLSQSRNVEAMTNVINTNRSIVNTRLNAQKEANEFLYKTKQSQLQTLETAYSNILTEQQKAGLEERKFLNELALIDARATSDIRKDILSRLAVTNSGAGLSNFMSMSTEELLAWSQKNAIDPTSYTNMTIEQAQFLPKDEYERWEKVNEFTTERESQAYVIGEATKEMIDMGQGLLDNEAGLSYSVGISPLGRTTLTGSFLTHSLGLTKVAQYGEVKNWRAEAKQFVTSEVFKKLAEITASSSLGAISDSEIALVKAAATSLNELDGTGKFGITEEKFKRDVQTVIDANKKIYIAQQFGKARYQQAGLREISDMDVIDTIYNATISEATSQENFYEQDAQRIQRPSQTPEALNLLMQEEGLRTSAYQDTTGTWTIGYGNTMIGGRPVQSGDRITEQQARQLLEQEADRHSNFLGLVQTNLTPNQTAALASFEYNLGSNIWNDPTARNIIVAINQGNLQMAGNLMQQFRNSRNPSTGKLEPNSTLAQRRRREAQLLFA